MTGSTPIPSPSDPTSHRVVDALVAEGLVQTGARDRAVSVVSAALAVPVPVGHQPVQTPAPPEVAGQVDVPVLPGQPAGASGRRRLAEALAYVGGSLVVSAVLVLIGLQWGGLGFGARVTLLIVCTVVLAAAGGVIMANAGGPLTIREAGRDVWRRLASVLLTGGAATLAGAAAVIVTRTMSWGDTGRIALPFAVLVVAAAAAYIVAPSAAGQLTIGFGAVWCAASLASDLSATDGTRAVGLAILGLGAVWVALAEKRVWREADLGRFLGSAAAFAGAQILLLTDTPALGYTLTFLVGVVGFALHWARRAWAYLVLGVLAFTTSVTEATMDWFDGSLGVAGGLLIAGLALIGSAALALRLRQEQPTGQVRPHDTRRVTAFSP
jgi:hypothetical protein